MKKIIILGAGGNSKVVLDIIKDRIDLLGEDLQVIGVLDDDPDKKMLGQYPVIGTISEIETKKTDNDIYFINGIGDSVIRRRISESYPGIQYYTAIHPSAIMGSGVVIGEGTIIMPGVIINADSVIGAGAILNSGAIIEHDNSIGNYSHLASGVTTAGNVSIGEGTFLGTGSKVIQGIAIGQDVIIGAGSVVISDIPDHATAVGVPAKVIKYRGL